MVPLEASDLWPVPHAQLNCARDEFAQIHPASSYHKGRLPKHIAYAQLLLRTGLWEGDILPGSRSYHGRHPGRADVLHDDLALLLPNDPHPFPSGRFLDVSFVLLSPA